MCGIAGFVDFRHTTNKEILERMTCAIEHRGPDSFGYHYDTVKAGSVGLGHRRLSIIDLSPLGNQPMELTDGSLRIIFNGEIYNYNEIKEELISLGFEFHSGSDTEVILQSFRKWGHAAVHKFIGMFAFALHDMTANKLFLYRDRPGVKPLHYYWKDDLLLFASELKSFFEHPHFEPVIDNTAVYNFLQYGYVPAPATIYQHTFKVEPGHYLEVDLETKSMTQVKYWSSYDYYNKPIVNISEEDALSELEKRVTKACNYRMVSDVPVGIFLSGGYDSSLITAVLQKDRTTKLKTFTIGFKDEGYNEAKHAQNVASHLGTDHHEYYCSHKEAKDIIPELPYYYDEPFGDSSAIPTILVSRFARKQVTVALSADAGDELFGGYTKYVAALKYSQFAASIPNALRKPAGFFLANAPTPLLNVILKGKDTTKENLEKYKRFIRERSNALEVMEYANRSGTPETVREFLSKEPLGETENIFHQDWLDRGIDDIRQMQAVDYLSTLSGDILTKVDRASMSVALEAREPLLDQNIIEWSATLPSHLKIQKGSTKYILKKLVHKYIPEAIMERPKMGFSVPLVDWFRTDLKELFEQYLDSKSLQWHGLFNEEKIKSTLQEYYSGRNERFTLLWYILMFQLWYEQWMIKKRVSAPAATAHEV